LYLTSIQQAKFNVLYNLSAEPSHSKENIGMPQNTCRTDLLYLLADFTVMFQSRLAL